MAWVERTRGFPGLDWLLHCFEIIIILHGPEEQWMDSFDEARDKGIIASVSDRGKRMRTDNPLINGEDHSERLNY